MKKHPKWFRTDVFYIKYVSGKVLQVNNNIIVYICQLLSNQLNYFINFDFSKIIMQSIISYYYTKKLDISI